MKKLWIRISTLWAWALLPFDAFNEIRKVLLFGASKYGPNNWQRLVDARTRYYDAFMRHADSWWAGEVYDYESRLRALAHIGCCLVFLLWIEGVWLRKMKFKEGLQLNWRWYE